MSIPNWQPVAGFDGVRYEKADGIGNATLLTCMTEEGQEGKQAFLEKGKPNVGTLKRLP